MPEGISPPAQDFGAQGQVVLLCQPLSKFCHTRFHFWSSRTVNSRSAMSVFMRRKVSHRRSSSLHERVSFSLWRYPHSESSLLGSHWHRGKRSLVLFDARTFSIVISKIIFQRLPLQNALSNNLRDSSCLELNISDLFGSRSLHKLLDKDALGPFDSWLSRSCFSDLRSYNDLLVKSWLEVGWQGAIFVVFRAICSSVDISCSTHVLIVRFKLIIKFH
ncbi:unnamed protein product [Moneuplotes crassus]|uniref:Uncharacterized protein n=1 Tax=Euplotes crassus TaxID=5936 RepID=A0AAD1XK77_EUPCR|nr:unnamed protein product [Moneuplotes crassus]